MVCVSVHGITEKVRFTRYVCIIIIIALTDDILAEGGYSPHSPPESATESIVFHAMFQPVVHLLCL